MEMTTTQIGDEIGATGAASVIGKRAKQEDVVVSCKEFKVKCREMPAPSTWRVSCVVDGHGSRRGGSAATRVASLTGKLLPKFLEKEFNKAALAASSCFSPSSSDGFSSSSRSSGGSLASADLPLVAEEGSGPRHHHQRLSEEGAVRSTSPRLVHRSESVV